MEHQLFSYGTKSSYFPTYFKCVLKVPIGNFSPGDEIRCISIDYGRAEITLHLSLNQIHRFHLRFDLNFESC